MAKVDYLLEQRTYVVVWRITEACDLDCAFCGYARSNRYRRETAKSADVVRVGRLLAEWARLHDFRLLISWLGGEPFIWTPLLDVSEALVVEGVAITATTNGSRIGMNGYEVDRLVTVFESLTVSIDARGEAHDHGRGQLGLYASNLKLIGALLAAASKSRRAFGVYVNLMLSRRSLPDLEQIVRELVDRGIERITINTLWVAPGDVSFKDKLSIGELDAGIELLEHLREDVRQKCTIAGTKRYFDRLRYYALNRPVFVSDCAPGVRWLFIDANSMVAPCAYTTQEYGISTDQIRSVEDLNRLPGRFSLAKNSKQAPSCFDCPDTNVFGKHVAGDVRD